MPAAIHRPMKDAICKKKNGLVKKCSPSPHREIAHHSGSAAGSMIALNRYKQ